MSLGEQMVRDGFAIIPGVLDAGQRESLLAAIAAMEASGDALRRGEGVYGIRNLLDAVPAVRETTESPAIRALVEPILGAKCLPVRGILFDKTPDANWKVPWHQDLTIAVRERRNVPGYGPWSEKAGVTHVQPPVAVLEQMLAVRLHLDPCGAENGPLRVLPGTHTNGRLNATQIQRLRQERASHDCLAGAGDAILMRPLLLHASAAATSPAHRRVIHLEFASGALDGGLEWSERRRDAGKIGA